MTATNTSTKAVTATTAGSRVKMWGSTSRRAKVTRPKTIAGDQAPLDHAPTGPAGAATSCAPRKRPIMAWPAMAMASRARASRFQIWKAI